jgi:uncharacterized protein
MQMKIQDHRNLLDDIKSVLLSDSPAVAQLQNHVEEDLSLSPDMTRSLIYQVVKELNFNLFPPITKLELMHTEGCNLACSYCFEKNILGYKKMPADVAKKAVDLLLDYSQNEQKLEITHFGGEPTLNFPAIKYVTEYAEQKASALGKSIDFHMTSNGVLIDENMADYFSKHKIMVLLSIDGLESTHNKFRITKQGGGSFKQAIKGMEILKRTQRYIGVKMTVMPQNVPNLYDDVIGLYGMGVNHFIIGYASGIPWSQEDMSSFSKQLGRLYEWYKQMRCAGLRIDEFEELDASEQGYFGCQAGRNSMSVAINGEISPCSKVLGLNNKQLIAKLGDVTYGLTHLRNRSELNSCSQLISICKTKGVAENYQGGCWVENYDENRDINQPSMQAHTFSVLKRSALSGCSGCNKH